MIKKSINNRPKKVIIPPSTIKSVTKTNKTINNITKSVDYIIPKKKLINTKYNTVIKKPTIKKYRNYTSIGRIEPLFKNQTIFLIGGGASLKGFNFNQLENKNTIAINKAFLYMPFANVLYWTDTRVYNWYNKEIDNFEGLKVTNKANPVRGDIINLLNTGKTGLELNNNGLRHGNNSGYAAINLAYHLGANRIILLGYDMGDIKNLTHWHDGYNIPKPKTNLYKSSMLPNFETLVDPLRKKNIEVINANLNSNLICFPKMDINRALLY